MILFSLILRIFIGSEDSDEMRRKKLKINTTTKLIKCLIMLRSKPRFKFEFSAITRLNSIGNEDLAYSNDNCGPNSIILLI